MPGSPDGDAASTLLGPVRDWFSATFPSGPTPAQRLAWPTISLGDHLLLVSPTGTGKTLAAFLSILDRLFREHQAGTLEPGLRCVYVSPLRSLGYDIERNLSEPLEAIRQVLGADRSPVTMGVRTGDTSAYHRRRLRDEPPHLLITTPESLSLLLSQAAWKPHWRRVGHLIVDEVHALVPTKRGADLAVSLERVSANADRDPCRIGLTATCRPAEPVARFLVGPGRACRVLEAPIPAEAPRLELEIESLLRSDEAPHRGLTYRRLLRRLAGAIGRERTTIVFANTRSLTEKITLDLRRTFPSGNEAVAAHHSSLDAGRRREVEAALKRGELRSVVTSTSLELGVDVSTADLTVQIGLPGGVSRLLQRVGRSGHRVGTVSRGLLFTATAAELAGAVVTVQEARAGRVEPLRAVSAPLDVLCQQLIGMACGGDCSVDDAYQLVRRASSMAGVERADFDACLDFLAGELPTPAGAVQPEAGGPPRWTAPRIWRKDGRFGIRSRRVAHWFRSNVGTITSEESVHVMADGIEVGTLEGAYAERLQAADHFVLDGRPLEFLRMDGRLLYARRSAAEPGLPRWSSDRQSLTAPLALALAGFREEAARRLADGRQALREWLCETHGIDPDAADVLLALFESQEQLSEVPTSRMLLVEESPVDDGWSYAFHAPLSRSASEALGRAVAARLGRRLERDVALVTADLGWSIRVPDPARLRLDDVAAALALEDFEDDVLDGLDRGELPARRFRHVAATALMVLRNPEGGRRRVGGLNWVSVRLYPLVKACCPDHPLLRETRREILKDVFDAPAAIAWLEQSPTLRFRELPGPSPFTDAWIDPAGSEPMKFESPAEALKRLHARLNQELE